MDGDIKKREENLQMATSSLLENSLPIFLPVKNIHKTKAQRIFIQNKESLKVKTSFGLIEIRGRILGQNHKDILETLLCQEKFIIKKDNSIGVNFGRYKFLQNLGRSTGNYQWLEERIKEVRDFNFAIEYVDTKNEKVIYGGFGIIDKYKFEENGTMSIKFTEEFSNFYREENLLHYTTYVPKIATLKEPFIKALVREMIKHKSYSIYFNNFIDNYNLKNIIGKSEIYNFKKLLKSQQYIEKLHKLFNIEINIKDYKDILISIKRDNKEVYLLENNKQKYPTKIRENFNIK